jgi:hypothetical protein
MDPGKMTNERKEMKRLLFCLGLAASAMTLAAAPLSVVQVGAPAINCVFNTNCTSIVTDTSSPITLPNSTGAGFLQTRTLLGETGSLAQGLYVYEYRIDLTGITPNPGAEPCLTNQVRCATNRVVTTSNILSCVTNQYPASNGVVCVTNRIPATNFVVFFTNTIPATNFVRCVTNVAGGLTCFTNFFPGTNIVFGLTNRVPATNVVSCRDVAFPATNVVSCTSNRLRFTNTVVQCSTNLVSCPGSAPCIDELRLNFGRLAGLNVTNPLGATGQVYVVTTGGVGSVAPTSVERSGSVVTIRFADGVCPGESSYFIGLISSNAPTTTPAVVDLTSGSSLILSVRTPRIAGRPITCDFSALRTAIANLALSDILAPNDHARAGRRGALLNNVDAAIHAAELGDLGGVLDALHMIANKTGNKANPWVRSSVGARIGALLDPLLDCLEQFHDGNGHDDGDDDDGGDHDDGDHDGDHGDHGDKGSASRAK